MGTKPRPQPFPDARQWLGHQRLRLEPLARRHAPALFELVRQERARLRQWLPWLDGTRTVDDTDCFIRASRAAAVAGRALRLAIVVDDVAVGTCGIEDLDWHDRRGAIGYWIGEAWEGEGWISAAAALLCRYGFHRLQLNRIELYAQPSNHRSCAVAERLGFRREGILRERARLYDQFIDLALYAVVAADALVHDDCWWRAIEREQLPRETIVCSAQPLRTNHQADQCSGRGQDIARVRGEHHR